jgi:2'-5' RNA ligase
VTQSVELLLDDDQDIAVRRQWAALTAAGLPSQADHPGASNRPHITLTIADAVPAYLETALKSALTGRVPVPVRLGGLLLFSGRGSVVLARAVVPNLELLELQATCAALFERLPGLSPKLRPDAWSPHVTLARRLPAEHLGTAIGALGGFNETEGAGVEVRRWDSPARAEWLLTRARARIAES